MSIPVLVSGILPHQILSWLDRDDLAVAIEYVSDTVGRSGGTTTPIVAQALHLVVLRRRLGIGGNRCWRSVASSKELISQALENIIWVHCLS